MIPKQDCFGMYDWDHRCVRDTCTFPPGFWPELDELRRTWINLMTQPQHTSRRDLHCAITGFRSHPRYREIMD